MGVYYLQVHCDIRLDPKTYRRIITGSECLIEVYTRLVIDDLRKNKIYYEEKSFDEVILKHKHMLSVYEMKLLTVGDERTPFHILSNEGIIALVYKKIGNSYIVVLEKEKLIMAKQLLKDVAVINNVNTRVLDKKILVDLLGEHTVPVVVFNPNFNNDYIRINKSNDFIDVENNVYKVQIENESFSISDDVLHFGNDVYHMRETLPNIMKHYIHNAYFSFDNDGLLTLEEKDRARLYNTIVNHGNKQFLDFVKTVPFRKIHNSRIVLNNGEKNHLKIILDALQTMYDEIDIKVLYERFYYIEQHYIKKLPDNIRLFLDSINIKIQHYNNNLLEMFRIIFHPLDMEQANRINHLKEELPSVINTIKLRL
jgi:hypothetical protein